jgi:hypothetical protein
MNEDDRSSVTIKIKQTKFTGMVNDEKLDFFLHLRL